jgi:hypothetical protein
MRIIALLVSLCALSQAALSQPALSQPALAQTPQCKAIANPNQRLDCYDKASPPVVAPPVARPVSQKIAPSKPDGSKDVDPISAEDARVSAQLKGICRGC